MVAADYPSVFRPRAVAFDELFFAPGGPYQAVLLVGPDGVQRRALYSLQRQPDGHWRITGCQLQ
jgi:hypothetical protein